MTIPNSKELMDPIAQVETPCWPGQGGIMWSLSEKVGWKGVRLLLVGWFVSRIHQVLALYYFIWIILKQQWLQQSLPLIILTPTKGGDLKTTGFERFLWDSLGGPRMMRHSEEKHLDLCTASGFSAVNSLMMSEGLHFHHSSKRWIQCLKSQPSCTAPSL